MLLAGAAATLWLRMGGERAAPSGELAGAIPDYTMQSFTATAMDARGRPEHELQAVSMIHFTDDVTELSEPRMTLFRPDGPPWRVVADEGRIAPGGELVTLRGNVRMSRQTEGEGSMLLLTDFIRIRPDDKYAETEAAVTISDPGTVVKAVGMQAYMAEERLILLSEVRSTYAPQEN